MALIEVRWRQLRIQILPVLGNRCSREIHSRECRRVVRGLRQRVLDAGHEAVAEPTTKLKLSGMTRRAAIRLQKHEARWARRTWVVSTRRECVRQRLLQQVDALGAEVRGDDGERAG